MKISGLEPEFNLRRYISMRMVALSKPNRDYTPTGKQFSKLIQRQSSIALRVVSDFLVCAALIVLVLFAHVLVHISFALRRSARTARSYVRHLFRVNLTRLYSRCPLHSPEDVVLVALRKVSVFEFSSGQKGDPLFLDPSAISLTAVRPFTLRDAAIVLRNCWLE